MQIKKPKIRLILGSVAALLAGALLSFVVWYNLQLRPADASSTDKIVVNIEPGTTPGEIADILFYNGLIRNSFAFTVHVKLNGQSASLQAGLHRLSPSQSVPDIALSLQEAETEGQVVQIVPGAMLMDNSSTSEDKKQDIRSTFERLGYSRADIERAFTADYGEYNDTLFRGRPQNMGIEGYIYGETYHMPQNASVEQIIRRSFDEFVKKIDEHKLEAKFAKQGLTLYEGITLASIVQKEVSCQGSQTCDDQRQVAQVFFKRLEDGISLGADATFVYAAAQAGRRPTVDFDSPYNTRIHTGLPPGPISSPGLGALLAVADPAEGDYLFFVSGDDGVNYFSRTEAEHLENTRRYCQVNCLLP